LTRVRSAAARDAPHSLSLSRAGRD
jgi:hypothetical protein